MKLKLLICAFCILPLFSVFGQDNTSQISLEIDNRSLKEIFLEIEQKSDFKFFYAEEWFDSELKFSKTYNNVTIDAILSDLFSETPFNFFVGPDHSVILTRNNIIYDELPENYFPDNDADLKNIASGEDEVAVPVLLEKEEDNSNQTVETIRIGKERRGLERRRFKLSGVVKDSKTGNPIPDVAIVVKEKNLGAISNNQGYYEINLPSGLNVVETSSLGIEKIKKNVILFNDGQLNFSLDSQYEQLNEVVVQSEGVKNIEDSSTGSSRIGSEDSKNIPLVLGERDVLKVATMLPGVTTAGEGSSGFNVRGGKSDQNLILLDNAVLYNPSHFFGIFQALNPLAIKDATIYKGSVPVEFGGRISSVFDITTKDANNQNFEGDLSAGPVTANAVIEVPVVKDKSGIMLGGRGAYSDWVLRSLDDEDLKDSQASFYDAIVKYNHRINEKNDLRLLGYYSKDKFSITSDSLYGYSNRLVSAGWNHTFNAKNNGSLIIANSQYQFSIDYEDDTSDNFEQSFKIEETELKLKMNYELNSSHQFNYGVSGKLYSVFPGEIQPKGQNNLITPLKIPKERGFESAIFVADEFKVDEKLLLDAGLRYSFYASLGPGSRRTYDDGVPKSESSVIDTLYYNNNEVIKTYGGPEVRLSARYLLAEDLSVKASYNNSYQFIHTLSNNTTVSPIDTWKLSDNHIKPQQAQQVALGIYKNIGINAYELSLEGFYKRQKNILDFKTGAKLLLNEHVETEVLQGKGKAYGIEFLIKKNTGSLNGWLGYTYSRSFYKLESEFQQEQVNGGRYFPANFDKPHDLSLVLNYKFTQRLSFSSNFVYQTGRPVTFPIGNYEFNGSEYVLYSDRNQFRIPDYYRLDVGFNLEGSHKKKQLIHTSWNLSVYNVLNRNNPYSVFFVNQDGEVKAYQSSIFSVPVPSLTFNMKF